MGKIKVRFTTELECDDWLAVKELYLETHCTLFEVEKDGDFQDYSLEEMEEFCDEERLQNEQDHEDGNYTKKDER